MNGMGLIATILIGILAGWIAEQVMRRNHGILTNLVVGVIGAFLGGFLSTALGLHIGSGLISTIAVASLGAILLLFILGLVRPRRRI